MIHEESLETSQIDNSISGVQATFEVVKICGRIYIPLSDKKWSASFIDGLIIISEKRD